MGAGVFGFEFKGTVVGRVFSPIVCLPGFPCPGSATCSEEISERGCDTPRKDDMPLADRRTWRLGSRKGPLFL